MIVGQIGRNDEVNGQGRVVVVFLDFAKTRTRQCDDNDFDSWYARSQGHECVMGHKVCIFLPLKCDPVLIAMLAILQAS